jgi:glycosyltransferase involved in cell wall biosynthesis
VIGLRVLHLATSSAAAEAGDVLTAMAWLKANGHDTALAAGGDGEIPGIEMIRFRTGTAAWWLGGKRNLIDQVQAWHPDLVHLHGIEALAAARALGARLDLPVLVSIDQVLSPARARGLRDDLVDWVLVPTEAHRAHFVGRAKVACDNVSVLPFAVDNQRLSREAARIGDPGATVGMTLAQDDHALEPALALMARVRMQIPAARLVLGLATGVDREAVEGVIAASGASEWCEALATTSRAALLARCDGLWHPTADDRPLATVIAAMAVGRVVLATPGTGIDELLRDDHSGVLLPSDDHSLAESALVRVLGDAGVRQRLEQAAQEQARARFAIDLIGPALIELYHTTISAAQNPGAKTEGSRIYQRRVSH